VSEWTPEQLRDLAVVMPDSVRVDEAGRIIPLIDRDEARHLLNRFPSCFGLNEGPAQAAGQRGGSLSEEDAALSVRYPSMYTK
jgi:hypothetical protein